MWMYNLFCHAETGVINLHSVSREHCGTLMEQKEPNKMKLKHEVTSVFIHSVATMAPVPIEEENLFFEQYNQHLMKSCR